MKTTRNVLYSFDQYTVDTDERRLWRNKELISLTPKAFDTLLVLIINKGKIVDKDFLLNEVWQDTFVEESTVAQNISTIRKALGTSTDGGQFIETIPRRGYRFLVDVREIIGDEEIILVERRMRTQISTEQVNYSDEAMMPSDAGAENPSQTASSARGWASRFKKINIRFVLTAIFGLALLAAAGLGVRYLLRPARLASFKFLQPEISNLTSDGNTYLVEVSPDGKFLAMVEKRGDLYSLLLRQTDNSTTIQVVPPKKQQYLGVTFSPDGKQLYYATYDRENPLQPRSFGKLYKVSSLGGQIQEMVEDIDSPITISPDGRRFAFVRHSSKEKESAVITTDFDSREEKKITSRKVSESFSSSGLSWSPDGKTIAAVVYKDNQEMDVIGIDVSSGEQRVLGSEKWQWMAFPNWLADGSGVIVSALNSRSGSQTDEIWLISFPEGATRKIAGGIRGVLGLSITADSQSLVAVKSELLSSFWVGPANDLKQAVKIRQSLPDYNINLPGISWSPDGKIVYGAALNGNSDIWMMDADGSHNRQLTNDEAADSMPVISADGADVFFISNRSGQRNIWRMKTDGSGQKQLTDEQNVSSPSLSADGKNIFYAAPDAAGQLYVLRRVSIDGGESAQLNSWLTLMPQASPDGKWIACYSIKKTAEASQSKKLALTILSTETFQIAKQFDGITQNTLSPIVWSDDQTFNYTTNEGSGSRLWQQSLDKGTPQPILETADEQIFRLAWSPKDRKLVYEKGNPINDIILIK